MGLPKFKPHYNRELGNKKFYTERDYTAAMKKAGLEPFNPSSVKKREVKPYEKSSWAQGMLQDICERRGRKPGGRFLDELSKRGYSQESANEARKIAERLK